MVEVIFNYKGIDTIIQCNINDKMKDIIKKFLIKIVKNENANNLFFIYNANIINYELTFIQHESEIDKNRNKMNIIVKSNNDNNNEIKEIISKDIICPECGENIFINIKDFKINLYGCKNEHIINNILIKNMKIVKK